MMIEDGVDFELSPHKVAFFRLVDNRPPKSPFQYAFHHDRIVSAANVSLVCYIFWL